MAGLRLIQFVDRCRCSCSRRRSTRSTAYPEPLRTVVQLTPLSQGVADARSLALGTVGPGLLLNVAYLRGHGPDRPGGRRRAGSTGSCSSSVEAARVAEARDRGDGPCRGSRGAQRGGQSPAAAARGWSSGASGPLARRSPATATNRTGAAGPGLRRPGGADPHRRPGAGRPRWQPDRPDVHRRPIGRLPLPSAARERTVELADVRAARRRPDPHRRPDQPRSSVAPRRPTSRRPTNATPACRISAGSSPCYRGPGDRRPGGVRLGRSAPGAGRRSASRSRGHARGSGTAPRRGSGPTCSWARSTRASRTPSPGG